MVEVGIVGKPNVGKSTFFKALTLAEVKIAAYPFTTLEPNVGVGYVRVPCPCADFGLVCNPRNSYCTAGNRFVPVKLIDVPGLVPGAHEGRGLGNKFLDALIRADVLLHIVDVSGTTDAEGSGTEGHDPEEDILFLEREIDEWFKEVVRRNWERAKRKARHAEEEFGKELERGLSGLGIKAGAVRKVLQSCEGLEDFAEKLRKLSKPIVLVANKVDLPAGKENCEKLSKRYEMIPASAEAELALRRAEKLGLVNYLPGDRSFTIKQKGSEEQQRALEFIRREVLEPFGSTGVQQALNEAVLRVAGQIVVFPVENETKLTDSRGNVLPDAHLLERGSTILDLAELVHSEIAKRLIAAINCRTKQRVGKRDELAHLDVVKLIHAA